MAGEADSRYTGENPQYTWQPDTPRVQISHDPPFSPPPPLLPPGEHITLLQQLGQRKSENLPSDSVAS